jgi:hypothetical protein
MRATTSPHGLIPPPIKRSKILVSGGEDSNLGKIICYDVCGCANLAGKFPIPDILRPEQKVALCSHKIGRLLFAVYFFRFLNLLFSMFCVLPAVERRTPSDFSPSLRGDSSYTIAKEFQDDLIDGRKVAEMSTVSAPKTVMTWRRH